MKRAHLFSGRQTEFQAELLRLAQPLLDRSLVETSFDFFELPV